MPKVMRAGRGGQFEEHEISEDEIAANQSAASASAPITEQIETTDDEDDILSLVAPERDKTVVEKTIRIVVTDEDGENEFVSRPVLIQRLSRREVERVEQLKWRHSNGRITLVQNHDTLVLANLLHLCVVRNVAAPGLKPVYMPRWTMAQIEGTPAKTNRMGELLEHGKPGLLDAKDAATEQLISQIQSLIWEVNPAMDPLVTAQALQSMV